MFRFFILSMVSSGVLAGCVGSDESRGTACRYHSDCEGLCVEGTCVPVENEGEAGAQGESGSTNAGGDGGEGGPGRPWSRSNPFPRM